MDTNLSKLPPALTRIGCGIILLTAAMFVSIAFIVKYSDTVESKVKIVTDNPPIKVMARTNGKMSQLFVNDKDTVSKGQIIGIIENTAMAEDIDELDTWLDKLNAISDPADYLGFNINDELVLGDLQKSFASLVQKISDYQFLLKQQSVFKKISSLRQQIKHIGKLNHSLEEQSKTLNTEVGIAKNSLTRSEKLFESKNISKVDVENAEINYLRYKRQLEDIETQSLNNEIKIEQIKTQIIDLKQNRVDTRSIKELYIKEEVKRLKEEIAKWKETFLIMSPISGQVSMAQIRNVEQFVKTNDEIFTIVPLSSSKDITIGRCLLPITSSGKIEVGDNVNVKLDGFPHKEFGTIQAKLNNISLVPNESSYFAEIEFPNGLTTTYGREIPLKQGMTGIADIVMQKRSFAERILDEMFNAFYNN